jgi:GT2 family glycosyltransferase
MVGGALFDEHHMPACCEDADLCVRICSVGKGIHYCPDAVVVRHLSVSMGPESDAKRLQQVSRSTFGAIWQNRRTK